MNEKKYKRIFTVVIDSLGAGEMPDAASYGDAGTDTLGHIAENVEEFKIPNLQKLGIANLKDLARVAPVDKLKTIKGGCPGGKADGPLHKVIRGQQRQGHHDRTLGDDGTSHYNSVQDIYRDRISKGTD